MTSNSYHYSATRRFSLAMLFGAAFVAACSQDDSARQQSAAGEDSQQQVDAQQNNQATDATQEERDTSVLATSAPAKKGVAQFAMIDIATAEIKPASGSDVQGSVDFKPGPERKLMQVEVKLAGLEPGQHALHIHEIGDCSAPDAASAGGHLNPYDASHGAPGDDEHHVGDMGNITADAQGQVKTTLSFDSLAFSGPANILNKAVVVHEGTDDLKSNPAGAAGQRIGCGVILAERDVLAPDE